ncbi:hypothetical protein [Haliovirga abyssi]|uniref:LysM domain-containing protein n=1 Tax=Haliovirga abyssi TaxID=2996794 RepID=A0AAU9D1Z4_9FUSO|nr:hypothetical protein [Haliovirga abyssi]BDU50021.1 hypothetical protein HLVA_05900 [Haliovirga abyssi]
MMERDIEVLIEEEKINLENIKLKKLKQSFEGTFFVSLFLIFTLIFFNVKEVKLVDKKQKPFKSKYRYNNNIKMNYLRKFKTMKKIKINKGDTIYSLFRDNKIPYSKKNIEKFKIINRINKRLRSLKIGKEIYLPIKIGMEE